MALVALCVFALAIRTIFWRRTTLVVKRAMMLIAPALRLRASPQLVRTWSQLDVLGR